MRNIFRRKIRVKGRKFFYQKPLGQRLKIIFHRQKHAKTPLFSRVLACFCSTWNWWPKSNCSTWNIWQFVCLSVFALRYYIFYCLFIRICFSSVLHVEYYWFYIPFACFFVSFLLIKSSFRQWLVCFLNCNFTYNKNNNNKDMG